MAKKIGSKAKLGTESPASELEILHPERSITLSLGPVTVREYGGVEWLRLLPRAAQLVEAISAQIEVGVAPRYEDALNIISTWVDELLPLVAQAADLKTEQLEGLAAPELELLLMTWWGVCGHFFIERAMNRVMVARQEKRVRDQLAGASSTQHSSAPGTGTGTCSTTPDAS